MTDTVFTGTFSNDGTGDPLRVAMQKINAQFQWFMQYGLSHNGYTNRGNWVTATAYAFEDLVINSGIPYLCVVAHTSGTFSTDLSANKWVIAGYDSTTPRSVSLGGTGASTASGAIQNLGLIDVNSSLVLTGTTVMDATYLGKCIILSDSGSPADYTVTLPSGSPLGSLILIRVANSATKLYTVAGSDVGLDGVASRAIWAGESVLLLRESGNWTKIGRVVRPMSGCLVKTATQTFSSGSGYTRVQFQSEAGDVSLRNLMFDSANGRISARRTGNISVQASVSIAGTCSVTGAVSAALSRSGSGIPTGSPSSYMEAPYAAGQTRQTFNLGGVFSVNAGFYIELLARAQSGTFSALAFEYATPFVASLSYAEIPAW